LPLKTIMPPEPSIQDCLRDLRRRFGKAGIDTAELDARLLVQAAAGLDHASLILKAGDILSKPELRALEKMAQRRLVFEPVSRILGEREFYGRWFMVTSDVLDPRPDTETLVEVALKVAGRQQRKNEPLHILDIGTGTGAIIISLLCELPDARGLATDISKSALEVARQNGCRLGVDSRLEFKETSWCRGVDQQFDMIVSNPPYIVESDINNLAADVKNFDPKLALDGGKDGLQAYRQIAVQSPTCLKSGGSILLETGFDQAELVVEIFRSVGFSEHCNVATIQKDMGGNDRVVTMVWNG